MNNKKWNIIEWGLFAATLLFFGILVLWIGPNKTDISTLSTAKQTGIIVLLLLATITAIVGILGWFRKDGPITRKKVYYAILIFCGFMIAKALREYLDKVDKEYR